MGVRLDDVLMSSLHESFKNYKTFTGSIVVSGSIPTTGKDFSLDIPYDRPGSIADIYLSKQGSNLKRAVSASYELSEFTDPNLQGNIYVLYSPGMITVNISIANLDVVAHTPTTQTFNISAEIFDAPIAN